VCPFASLRLDEWVFKVGIAIPLVFLAGLGLWQLITHLGGKLPKRARAVRISPEPPSSERRLRDQPAPGRVENGVDSMAGTPEQLQQICTEREDELAGAYMALAESWSRQGQLLNAAAALKKVLQLCPERHPARLAGERLERIRAQLQDPYS
jgi:hypothetical protein